MTKEEAKAYLTRVAKEAGMSDEDTTRLTTAFDHEKVFNAFVPRPEVDRAISSEKEAYKTYKTRNEYLENEWLPSAKQAEAQAKQVYASYKKYVEAYGPIDDADPAAIRRAANATGLTKEEVTEMLQSQITDLGRSSVELMRVNNAHFKQFKEPLDVDAFEAYVMEQRKKGNTNNLIALHKDWMGPEIEKRTPHRFSDEELKARDKRLQEDAVKDFASRNHIPADARPREPHLLFDDPRRKDKGNGANGNGDAGGLSAKDEFLSILNDPEPETLRKRYPS